MIGWLKCRQKTQRGNYHADERSAKTAAASMSRATGDSITFFKCKFCDGWHLGGWRTIEEQRRRK